MAGKGRGPHSPIRKVPSSARAYFSANDDRAIQETISTKILSYVLRDKENGLPPFAAPWEPGSPRQVLSEVQHPVCPNWSMRPVESRLQAQLLPASLGADFAGIGHPYQYRPSLEQL